MINDNSSAVKSFYSDLFFAECKSALLGGSVDDQRELFPPFSRCTRGWGLSRPSTKLGLAAQGVTLDTPVRSIQC